MSKKKKNKDSLDKTLVEKILDQHKIPYKQHASQIEEDHGVAQVSKGDPILDGYPVYKTLAMEGNKTGPLVGVIPLSGHLDMKKIAKASGNKKCEMIPLKKLEKTTGYVHGPIPQSGSTMPRSTRSTLIKASMIQRPSGFQAGKSAAAS